MALTLCLLVIPALFPTDAEAGSIGRTLTEFGFMGSWAQDCGRPADRDNIWRQASPIDDGGAIFTESLGEGFQPSIYRILAVRRTLSDTVVLTIELNSKIRQDLTMVLRGNRIRTMTNHPAGLAKPVVKDGVVIANGAATPWLTRCEARQLQG